MTHPEQQGPVRSRALPAAPAVLRDACHPLPSRLRGHLVSSSTATLHAPRAHARIPS